ncbi:MAG: thiamine pyrophosphate-binding protein, partial [Halobacteriota archaeon]
LPMDVALAKPEGCLADSEESVSAGIGGSNVAGGVPDGAVSDAVAILANATAPIIIAGGGIRAASASSQLRTVAERLEAPVFVTYKGKGVFPDDHDLAAGTLCGGTGRAVAKCIADADAALGIGTDFDAVATKHWSLKIPDDLVHVTLDPGDIGINYEPAVGIAADASQTLSAFDDALAETTIASTGGVDRARATRAVVEERIAELDVDASPLTSVTALRALRKTLPREAIVTADAGGFRLWTALAFDVYDPRDYVHPGSWCSMGTGLPSAIGAKAANPDRDVVAFTGDGGLMMCVHELHTLADQHLDVTVVVLNNSDYAIISEEAEREYRIDLGEYGWQDVPIDFCSIGEGMGLETSRVESAARIESTVTAALESDGPALVEIPTDPFEPQASVWMND